MNGKELIRKHERVNSLRRARFAKSFEGLPLTCVQSLVLRFVVQQAEFGEVYPKDVERFLSIRGSSVNSLLNPLEREGYLVREATKVDGRYKRLVPTPKGRALRGEIDQRIDRFVEELFADIPESELQQFETVLDRMEQNLKKAEG